MSKRKVFDGAGGSVGLLHCLGAPMGVSRETNRKGKQKDLQRRAGPSSNRRTTLTRQRSVSRETKVRRGQGGLLGLFHVKRSNGNKTGLFHVKYCYRGQECCLWGSKRPLAACLLLGTRLWAVRGASGFYALLFSRGMVITMRTPSLLSSRVQSALAPVLRKMDNVRSMEL